MSNLRDVRDEQRRAYLDRVLLKLEGPERDRIVAMALAVVDKWETVPRTNRTYLSRWRSLLRLDARSMRKALMASGDSAYELRHCMPFAGVLSNRERAQCREAAARRERGRPTSAKADIA